LRHKRFRGLPLAVAVLAALPVAACGAPASTVDAATTTGAHLQQAVAGHDAAAICRLLTPATSQSLAQDGSCPTAVSGLHLSDPGPVRSAQVWGSSALITYGHDVAFLTKANGRWLVSAAGCTLHEESPADCDLEAGS
jgi:hypothetical protein